MASKIKPVPPERIAAKYKSGELKQIVNEFLIVGPYGAARLAFLVDSVAQGGVDAHSDR